MPNKLKPCPFCGDENIDTWDKISATGRTVFLLIAKIANVKDPFLAQKKKP